LTRAAGLALAALVGCGTSAARNDSRADAQAHSHREQSAGVRLEPVVAGLTSPVHLASPPGDPRLFVVEQPGRIRVIRDGRLLATPYLDITDSVGSGGERGLLSVAFHPRFRDNSHFYVDYTDLRGDTHVARFTADPAADTAGRTSERLVLCVRQPFANHNGGHVQFGPDRMLWIGMGDGGAAGDPFRNAQNLRSLLGKLLRIDVDRGEPYAIPPDNPYATGRTGGRPDGRTGPRPEIWAYGLRNPWRIAFDSGLVYIADVGQDKWEEIDVVPASRGGLDFGWRAMEGAHCYLLPLCRRQARVLPAVEYGRDDGCSVIGGVVYRGRAVPQLVGHYLYSDWCQGWLRSFRYAGGAATDVRLWPGVDTGSTQSFGEDASGEVYVLAANGTVYRIVAAH
jgi:glucose/arabinose dehydrogenase